MTSVSIHLVPCLSLRDVFIKVLIEGVEVHDKFESSGRCEIMFRMNGEIRVIAFVSKGQDTSSLTRGIVVGKFSEGKKSGPIILLLEYIVL